jgi:hypothetical protein
MTMQRDENRGSGFFHSVSGQLTALGIAVAVLVVLGLFVF